MSNISRNIDCEKKKCELWIKSRNPNVSSTCSFKALVHTLAEIYNLDVKRT